MITPKKTQMNKMVKNERGTVNVLGRNVPDQVITDASEKTTLAH